MKATPQWPQRAPGGAPFRHERHCPEQTSLYRLVNQHAASFIADTEASTGAELPRFIKNEFDAYLECGILAYDFLRLRCGECDHDMPLAFSCERRGLCPPCRARRMSRAAANMVDHVILHVPRVAATSSKQPSWPASADNPTTHGQRSLQRPIAIPIRKLASPVAGTALSSTTENSGSNPNPRCSVAKVSALTGSSSDYREVGMLPRKSHRRVSQGVWFWDSGTASTSIGHCRLAR